MKAGRGIRKTENEFQPAQGGFIDIWLFEDQTGTEEAVERLSGFYKEINSRNLTTNKYGKPELKDIHFGFTNTSGLSAAALCNYSPIGLDCEQINKEKSYINAIESLYHSTEKHYARNTGKFCKIWTIKEAITKYHGSSIWFADQIVTDKKTQMANRKWTTCNGIKVWSCRILRNYCLALAVKSKPLRLRFFSFG
ncbi:MAG: 4'-phosphopantetheinyl transferase superfamily protein [Spirochaetales bacterium]|nr:4'-phosphopantetheinyl transferase superfamily protein [Spirochaetales bacterium]